MNYTFKMIRRVAGKNIKSLYLPIVLSCVDALLHMGMFSTMIMTIIELIGGVFTMQRLTLYGVILVLLFLMRAILFSINYTQVQYRGADISAQQRLSLGDHIRSLNLGYFNKNSIGRLMSTLTTDITDFEQVLTHSLASLIKVLFFSALALLFAFMVSWQYGLIATVLILIAFPLMRLSGEMSQKYGGRQRASVSRVISRIVEYINGIRTFKLYNMTGEKFQRLDDSFTSLKKDSVKLELSIMPFSISFSFLTSLILPAALILAPALYQAGVIDTQRMIALLMICPYDFRADKGAGVEHYLMPQKMLIRKTEELAKASSSALVYCIAERSVLRILLPQAILNRFDGMNRLDIIDSV